MCQSFNAYIYTCRHTCIHISTYKYTHIHTYIQIYTHTDVTVCQFVVQESYLRNTHIKTYIHACIHTYIHIYMHVKLSQSQVSINRYVSIPNGIRSVSAQMENHELSTVKMVVNN